MNTHWVYSEKTETERILSTAYQLSTGFYQAKNFITLPPHHIYAHEAHVFFPDLPFTTIPAFWKRVSRIDVSTLPPKGESALFDQTTQLLNKYPLEKPDFHHLKEYWTKGQERIIHAFELLLGKKNLLSRLTIMPTSIGTNTSFSVHHTFPADMYIYIRDDQNLTSLIEAILTALTRHSMMYEMHLSWEESEGLTDWLITHSFLKDIIQAIDKGSNHKATLKETRTVQRGGALLESKKFLKKLGLPIFESHMFSLNNNKPYYKNNKIDHLTEREEKILTAFLKNPNTFLTIDDLSDLLFTNEDEFSLFSITKTIQRLRDKFEENGISGYFIQTVRGKGYWLKN